MEVLCGFFKVSINFTVKTQSGFNDRTDLTLDGSLEFGEMSSKISGINDGKRGLIWHTDGKEPEMSLQSRIDNERTSSWVHGSNELSVLDFFHCQFTLIVPMLVISMLSQKSNGVLGIIRISLRHVQVITEINQFICSFWCENLTRLFLKVLL